jgi:hypothetical protein
MSCGRALCPLTPEGHIEPLLALLAQDESLARHAYFAVTVEGRALPGRVLTLLRAHTIPLFHLVTELEALVLGVARAGRQLRSKPE